MERLTILLRLGLDELLTAYDELVEVCEDSERSRLIDDTIDRMSCLICALAEGGQ